MTMMTIDEIVAKTDEMDSWKAHVMCAAAAERVAPVFRKFGRAASVPAFETVLDGLWAAVESGSPAKGKGALQRLPETRADDSYKREYYAGRVLQILFSALDSVSEDESAGTCLEETANLCDDFDTLLTAKPGQTFRYDPTNPPPPGEIQTEELRAQSEVLEMLRDAPAPKPNLIESLRRRAREHSSVYDAAAPRLPLT